MANSTERSSARAGLGGRFARNGEMAAQLLQIEIAMDALAERAGVAPIVGYVYKFTEAARAVEHAVSLALRAALALLTKFGKAPPEALLACIDAVHGWFFDLAEHVADLIELQNTSRGSWGIPGRFLPEYSASYVSCKIEPAIEQLLVECKDLFERSDERASDATIGPAAILASAIDRLCQGVSALNDGLRVRV